MTTGFIQQHKRSRHCGAFRDEHVGQQATVYGWVQSYRDHGGVIFVDLRDRTGIVQLRFEPSHGNGTAHAIADKLRTEWVIGARGEVISRGTNINPKIPTGAVEILVDEVTVLNEAKTPPFEIKDEIDTNETTRLTYRYLDLRRPKLSANLALRSRVNQLTRRYFCEDHDFLELETPILAKSTPEGARDYLVPSRVHPGEFYALPQSPQQFKQLFMMSGMDRYMQICRCFRDEDLRADRQPEFTQLDLELSFVDVDEIRTLLDGYVSLIWKAVKGTTVPTPIPSITYQEAMDKYGIDRPDLRFGLPLSDLTEKLAGRATFRVFTDAFERGGIVKALAIPDGSSLTRKDLDKTLPAEAAPFGARGVAWARIAEDGAWSGPVAKGLDDALKTELLAHMEVGPGALILFVADKASVVNASLARLRQVVGDRLGLIDPEMDAFCWVVDFPMFEYDEGAGRWFAMHHPFTSPMDSDVGMLDSDPGKVRAKAYDLVLNGIELGGGSIRIHRSDVQDRVFALLGLDEAERRDKFGFFIDALSFGTPPHGGIALGMDRLMMLLCGADSLRDVIAFPKTQRASDLMTESPSEVSPAQLEELHVRTVVPTPDA
ncbi:MAG: aspartate--tRNA ligase [Deltaproteobacteria bacterium]|nr:aspartate--tRNA ligase [Deltaproteobacteria bacterium]